MASTWPVWLFTLLMGVSFLPPVIGESGVDRESTELRSVHPGIHLMEPKNGTVWTAGENVTIVIGWSHDPDPVHRIRLDLSVAGCLGDVDKSFQNVVPNFTSSSKNGDNERVAFRLDPNTPATEIACLRLIYESPSAPGLNSSPDFTILNPSDPVPHVDLDIIPASPWVWSGVRLPVNARARVGQWPLWLAQIGLGADIGSLSKVNCTADLDGDCLTDFLAPEVQQDTWATISGNVTHPNFTGRASSARVLVRAFDPITMSVVVTPEAVYSGGKAGVDVVASRSTEPATGMLAVPVDVRGDFEPEYAPVDAEGIARFVFTAPAIDREEIVALEFVLKDGGMVFANGSGKIRVVPAQAPGLVVVSTDPVEGASGVPRTASIRFTFDRQPRPGESLSFVEFSPPVAGVTLKVVGTTVTAVPESSMRPDTRYRVTIRWTQYDALLNSPERRSFDLHFTTASETPAANPPPAASGDDRSAGTIAALLLLALLLPVIATFVLARRRRGRTTGGPRTKRVPVGKPQDISRLTHAARQAASRAGRRR